MAGGEPLEILPHRGRGTMPFDAACGVAQDKLRHRRSMVEGRPPLRAGLRRSAPPRVPLHPAARGVAVPLPVPGRIS